MKLATIEKAEEIHNKAKDWLDNSPSAVMFGSSKTVAKLAVAEFLANQEGLTLYECCAEKPSEKLK